MPIELQVTTQDRPNTESSLSQKEITRLYYLATTLGLSLVTNNSDSTDWAATLQRNDILIQSFFETNAAAVELYVDLIRLVNTISNFTESSPLTVAERMELYQLSQEIGLTLVRTQDDYAIDWKASILANLTPLYPNEGTFPTGHRARILELGGKLGLKNLPKSWKHLEQINTSRHIYRDFLGLPLLSRNRPFDTMDYPTVEFEAKTLSPQILIDIENGTKNCEDLSTLIESMWNYRADNGIN
ncbi:MAG: hypothetical protein H7230_03930 [Candidatus Parcubacteria bacterium]|nr:hypothetical protein [Candidatus Paceibacterota bacterium]